MEWWSLLFLIFIFAQAGCVARIGLLETLSSRLMQLGGGSEAALSAIVLSSSAVTSSVLDNVVVVAAYIPLLKSVASAGGRVFPLWWALLFGGCLGGNITIIGSTANIIGLGLMQKRTGRRISFMAWLKVGLIIGVVTVVLSFVMLTLLSRFMP